MTRVPLPPHRDPDEPMRESLTDAEIRLLIYEATRLKNGRIHTLMGFMQKGSVCVQGLTKAA